MFGVVKTVLCFLLPFACSQRLNTDIKFKSCDESRSNITSVDLTPCDNPDMCTFKHGINVTITVNFKSGMDASALTNLVYGIVAGVPVPYPLPNPDACNGCNLNCPVKKDQEYTYINTLPVKQDYPDIKLAVKWEIVDEQKQPLVCFTFPMQIQG